LSAYIGLRCDLDLGPKRVVALDEMDGILRVPSVPRQIGAT
jgi:hypothetical protein